jgi:hypothetical protein
MPRGSKSVVGDRFTNANGYTYEKTDNGWEALHKLIAERKLGRPLKTSERVYFKDSNRRNIDPDNIGVKVKLSSSSKARLALVEAKIADLKDQLKAYEEEAEKLHKKLASIKA